MIHLEASSGAMSSSLPVLPSSSVQAASINSNIRSVGHMFSTPAECPQDIPFSSASEIQFTSSISHPQESGDISWGPDLFQDILQFPDDNVPIQNDRVEHSAPYTSSDNAKATDFRDWVEQLMSVDDSLQPNWNELLSDNNVAEPKSKVCFLSLILILCCKVSICLLLPVKITRTCRWHFMPLYG